MVIENIHKILKTQFGLTRVELKIFDHIVSTKDMLTTFTIKEELKYDSSTIQRALKKIFNAGFLKRYQRNNKNGGYEFMYDFNPSGFRYKLIVEIDKCHAKQKECLEQYMLMVK